jgi:hypothetical protein
MEEGEEEEEEEEEEEVDEAFIPHRQLRLR